MTTLTVLDSIVNQTEKVLGIKFVGKTDEEKEAFIRENKEAYRKVVDTNLRAAYELYTNQVKVFRLNDYEWVAAKTLEEAIGWYKLHIIDDEESIYDECEEDLDKLMITLEALAQHEEGYDTYKELQNEFYVDKTSSLYEVPAKRALEVQWLGEPFYFASTEY